MEKVVAYIKITSVYFRGETKNHKPSLRSWYLSL